MGSVLLVAVSAFFFGVFAQNPPQMGTLNFDPVTVGSGANYLIVPGIHDGDGGASQITSVTALSSNNSILEVTGVEYTPGNRIAIIMVTEKGTLGSANITVTVTDVDGSDIQSAPATVAPLDNPGIYYEVHDIVFWQQRVPLTTAPVWYTVRDQSRIQVSDFPFDEIPLTVSGDCRTFPPCTGNDFFTGLYKGFVVPAVSGTYTFYFTATDQRAMFISTSENRAQAEKILDTRSGSPLGTDMGGGTWRSITRELVANRVYAFHAVHWTIHNPGSTIEWSGPGITRQIIPGARLMPFYSTTRPGIPQDLTVVSRANNFIHIEWAAPAGGGGTLEYLIYVNGVYHSTTQATSATISGLSGQTVYSFFIVTKDIFEMRSFPSGVATASTHGVDVNPPTPPSTVEVTTLSDLAVAISWSGATDAETEVSYYNVFLNDVAITTEPWFSEEKIIGNLVPQTSYSVQIEAVDAAGNVSIRSAPLNFTTTAFDAMGPELGHKKASVSFSATAKAYATGFGVNPSYTDGSVFNANTRAVLNDLRPNLLRWGALDANPLNFSAHIGTGRTATYGRFLALCNEIGAYCAITTGVKDGTDWRNDIQTFANFIEYLNGPSTTTYGAIRAAEGFAQPLMANSKGLLIELGNEVWGAAAHNAEIGSNYTNYGIWCRQVAAVMKASPYYDHDKMWIVYSVRNPHPQDSYGLNFQAMMGDTLNLVEMIGPGGYLGGNLNYDPEIAPGQTEGNYYREGMKRVGRNITGLKIHHNWTMSQLGHIKPSFLYETNMTTPPYNGRLGQAVTMINFLAEAIEYGSVLPALFHLTGGEWRMVRVNEGNFKLPLFHASALYNRFCQGIALDKSIETQGVLLDANNLTVMYNQQITGEAQRPFEPIGFHLYNNGNSFTVLLASRDFENDYTVQVNLLPGIGTPTAGQRYVLSGSDFSTFDAVIDSGAVSVTDGMLVTVPRHSIVYITFTATGLGYNLPLGYYVASGIPAIDNMKRAGELQRMMRNTPLMVFDLRGRLIYKSAPQGFVATQQPAGIFLHKHGEEIRRIHGGIR